MSKLRNHVQLIGNIGDAPKVTDFENGKKVARFPLATNEHYRNDKGEKVESTDWHNVVAWGKTAGIIEKYAAKGRQLGIVGKLKTRKFTAKDGNERYVTEVVAHEVQLFGARKEKAEA